MQFVYACLSVIVPVFLNEKEIFGSGVVTRNWNIEQSKRLRVNNERKIS